MSMITIRSILESALKAVDPTMQTAYENVKFTPTVGVPFQVPYIITSRPQNPTIGGDFYREVGYMQVNLYYPLGEGSLAITTRAELIRNTFKRGATFTKNDTTVVITGTPDMRFVTELDHYVAILKIYFFSDIFQS